MSSFEGILGKSVLSSCHILDRRGKKQFAFPEAWSDVADQFVMSLSSALQPDAALTLNEGKTFELESLVFTILKGGKTFYLKDVSITANTASISEPATATLGLLAIAGLCACRRRR